MFLAQLLLQCQQKLVFDQMDHPIHERRYRYTIWESEHIFYTDPVLSWQFSMAVEGRRLVARLMTLDDGAATRLRLLRVLNIFAA